MQTYETIPKLMAALKKRGIQASREEVEAGIEHLGLREPFDPGDLDDLVSHLGPNHAVNQRINRVSGVLSGKEWRDAVVAVRLELGLSASGLPGDQALAIHKGLLDTELRQQPIEVQFNALDWRPVAQFWKELISASRRLCAKLGIDPRPLDNLRETYAAGTGNALFGVGKLLSPEAVIKVGGNEVSYRPTQIDYLIGHVLWGLPLDPETMEPKPSVSYEWKKLADGGGRFTPHVFNENEATTSERKVMRMKLEDAKRTFNDCLLITVDRGESWRGVTWEERWRAWNRLYPDFEYPTKDALRKACKYAVNHEGAIRARYEKLTEQPVPSR